MTELGLLLARYIFFLKVPLLYERWDFHSQHIQ